MFLFNTKLQQKNIVAAMDKISNLISLRKQQLAKLDELVNVYSKGTTTEKDNVFELLKTLYPTENSRLKKIKEESKS